MLWAFIAAHLGIRKRWQWFSSTLKEFKRHSEVRNKIETDKIIRLKHISLAVKIYWTKKKICVWINSILCQWLMSAICYITIRLCVIQSNENNTYWFLNWLVFLPSCNVSINMRITDGWIFQWSNQIFRGTYRICFLWFFPIFSSAFCHVKDIIINLI